MITNNQINQLLNSSNPLCGQDKKDTINPSHYRIGGIEQIDFNRAKMTHEQFTGWLLGDCLKYLGRYNHKHTGLAQLDDLKKARWYLDKLISIKEEKLNE